MTPPPLRRRLLAGTAAALALGAIAAGSHQLLTWPDVRSLATRNPETTAFVERHRARLWAAGAAPAVRRHWVDYAEISDHLKRAVVVAEDIGFFFHDGFALDEMKVALREALAGKRKLRGASTITQQLAKNLWLSPSRNPLRKLKETLLTLQLERHLSKRRILELYLNAVEFGPGIYGAEAAAWHYFGKSAAGLTEREAALLAAALPMPSRWHPGRRSPSYERYVAEIERRMDRATSLVGKI